LFTNTIEQDLDVLAILNQSVDEKGDFVHMFVQVPNCNRPPGLWVLLDTGALSNNYVSAHIASMLVSKYKMRLTLNNESYQSYNIQAAFGNQTQTSQGTITLDLIFKNQKAQQYHINLTAQVIEMDFDLIIGRPSIKELNLVALLPDHFAVSEEEEVSSQTYDRRVKKLSHSSSNDLICGLVDCKSNMELSSFTTLEERVIGEQSEVFAAISERNTGNASKIAPYELDNITDLKDDQLEAIPTDLVQYDNDLEDTLSNTIHFTSISETLKNNILQLVNSREYRKCFSAKLDEDCAVVTPFSLMVNDNQWESRANRAPPRRLDFVRQRELKKQIENFKEVKIIEPSTASAWSHPHMVPKPNNK